MKSAPFLQSILDGLEISVLVVDHTGDIVLTNKAYRDFAEHNGISPETVCEHVNYLAVCDHAQGKDSEEAALFAQGIRDVLAGTRPSFGLEYPCHSRDEQRWFFGSVAPQTIDGARFAVVSHQRLHNRRETEETLRQEMRRAEALLKLPSLTVGDDPSAGYDEKQFMQRGMELAEDLTGSSIAFIHLINDGGEDIELVAWSRRTLLLYCTAAYDSHYPVGKAGIWADALRTRTPVILNDYPGLPHKHGLPEGHSTLQRMISVPVIEGDSVVMLAGVGNKETDYTEFDSASVQLLANAIWQIVQKRRASEAVKAHAARLDQLAAHLPGALYQFQLDAGGSAHVPYASPRIADIYGVSPRQLAATAAPLFTTIHPDDLAQVNESIRTSALTLAPWRNQHRVVLPDGRTIWVEGVATPTAQADGSVLWHGYVRDVTEQRAVEARLRELTRAVEQSRVTIVITDRDGNIEYANPHFETTSGYTVQEVLGQNPRILKSGATPPETYAALWKTLLAGREWQGELHNKRKDGTHYWESAVISPVVDQHGAITNFIAVKEDITGRRQLEVEREKLQTQLFHSQKIESVGRLAGGIAHDLNNLLTVVLGTVELVQPLDGEVNPYEADFAEIRGAAQRAASLTRQLLTFSRRGKAEFQDTSLNELVTQSMSMLRRVVGEDISLVTQFDEDAGIVRVDVGQMDQVIMNLTVNARDAMPTGGSITISTARVPGADAVRLTVRDTGSGMSVDVQRRLFEPFFTTKAVGRGTGLGLSIVHGIVTQSGGTISVESAPGEGTAFHIVLPSVGSSDTASLTHETSAIEVGQGVILVVDDEPALGKVTQRALQKAGYTVLLTQSGEEAFAMLERHRGAVDVLVTDVVMPDMSGPALATAVQARYPGIRVLFVSGYTGDTLTNHGMQAINCAFLAKPFTIAQLTRKVKELLAG